MEIREINYAEDIDKINNLLELSLGKHHSDELFLWKHVQNPFGKSLGLLAFDDERIVGVKMFMKWNLQRNGKKIKALRPVDTVIHQDYRRKGLFKKLTHMGLEKFKDSYDIIFNTPNSNSLSGNLKMGWNRFEQKFNYYAVFFWPYTFTSGEIRFISIDNFKLGDSTSSSSSFFRTALSNAYIKWRFASDSYNAVEVDIAGYKMNIIFKFQSKYGIKYILIEEIMGNAAYFKKALKVLATKTKVFLFYILLNEQFNLHSLFCVKRNEAVVVFNKDKLNVNRNIRFSLGDLEASL
ncbi:GNAT family N-acetyltransferase [Salinimicrobium sp. GXAS 041]|uniref:GNAT family N-acetyltransferase n=1 Tax=Salinimicrobium sp. GXAS 041 TaxID=3400806 RepID=UPI003C78B232